MEGGGVKTMTVADSGGMTKKFFSDNEMKELERPSFETKLSWKMYKLPRDD